MFTKHLSKIILQITHKACIKARRTVPNNILLIHIPSLDLKDNSPKPFTLQPEGNM